MGVVDTLGPALWNWTSFQKMNWFKNVNNTKWALKLVLHIEWKKKIWKISIIFDFESQPLPVFEKSPLHLLIERGQTIENWIVSPKLGSFFQSEKFVCLRGLPIFLATVTSTVSWNPTIYNIIRWIAGPIRQTTCQPSVRRSEYFFS